MQQCGLGETETNGHRFHYGKRNGKGKSISYDLLRIRSEAPAFTREYLFTHFIETYQQQGYQLIDIGMAPLANVGRASTLS